MSSVFVTPEEAQRLQECLQEIAAILYKNTDQTQLTNLEAIENTVRQQMLEHVSPNIALFLSNKSPLPTKANHDKWKAAWVYSTSRPNKHKN